MLHLNNIIKKLFSCIYLLVFILSSMGVSLFDNKELENDFYKRYGISIKVKYWYWGIGSHSDSTEFLKRISIDNDKPYYIEGNNCIVFKDIKNCLDNLDMISDIESCLCYHKFVVLFKFNTETDKLEKIENFSIKSRVIYQREDNSTKEYHHLTEGKMDEKNTYFLFYLLMSCGCLVCFLIGLIETIRIIQLILFCDHYDYSNQEGCINDDNGPWFGVHCPQSIRSCKEQVAQNIFIYLTVTLCFAVLSFASLSRLSSFVTESHFYALGFVKQDGCYERNVSVGTYRILQDMFGIVDDKLTKLYFDFLIERNFIYNDQVGMPLSLFREFLSLLALTRNVNITLKFDGNGEHYVLDSMYHSVNSEENIYLLYDSTGYISVLKTNLKETIAGVKLPYEVMLK
jgi:hypothetical protein